MASRTELETMIKLIASKNLLRISTLLFVGLTGAFASAAQNLQLETTGNTEGTRTTDATELESVPASAPTRAFTARARGPVRLRQRQAQGTGAAASGTSTNTLHRFQPATQRANEAPSTACNSESGLKRFGGRTLGCG
jgi:hypothetical protein